MDIYEVQDILRENAIRDKKISLTESKRVKSGQIHADKERDVYSRIYERDAVGESYDQFRQDVTVGFVTEALVCLVNSCMDRVLVQEEYSKALSRQLVSNFVKQEGASKLLGRFKRSSYLLSEMAYVCETTIKAVLEKADKNDKTTHKIDPKQKDDFYKKLDKVDADSVIDDIRDRVKLETEKFIDSNAQRKMEIEKTLNDTKKKVEDAKQKRQSPTVQEGYVNVGKEKIADIRANRTQSVYEAMVYSLARAAMKNDEASKVFIENASLNMDKITEHCEVMYTFLTVLDACKITNVDEAYISQMLSDMKN